MTSRRPSGAPEVYWGHLPRTFVLGYFLAVPKGLRVGLREDVDLQQIHVHFLRESPSASGDA